MKKILIKDNHLTLYKRKESKIWQIKIKKPFSKAERISSGTSILQDAKIIAIKKYNKIFSHVDHYLYPNKFTIISVFSKNISY